MPSPNPYQPPAKDHPRAVADHSPEPFTVLDWIGVLITLLGALSVGILSLRVAPIFRQMFLDLGSPQLPVLTRLALAPWFGPALAAGPVGLTAAALRRSRLRLGQRRALVVVAFLITAAAAGLILFGLYQPIFDLSGRIRPAP